MHRQREGRHAPPQARVPHGQPQAAGRPQQDADHDRGTESHSHFEPHDTSHPEVQPPDEDDDAREARHPRPDLQEVHGLDPVHPPDDGAPVQEDELRGNRRQQEEHESRWSRGEGLQPRGPGKEIDRARGGQRASHPRRHGGRLPRLGPAAQGLEPRVHGVCLLEPQESDRAGETWQDHDEREATAPLGSQHAGEHDRRQQREHDGHGPRHERRADIAHKLQRLRRACHLTIRAEFNAIRCGGSSGSPCRCRSRERDNLKDC